MPQNSTYFVKEQSGYDELKDWTPVYWQAIKEADANLQFAGKTIDYMADALETWCKNMFIDTMDNEMLARMERFYYLDGTGRTIEERRTILKATQSGSGRMNTARVKKIIEAYTGHDCEISFADIYRVFVNVNGTTRKQRDDMRDSMYRQMPAHIKWYINCKQTYEEVIDESQLESINLNRILFQISISVFNLRTFEGTWLLDGSLKLDSESTYNAKVSILNKYKIEVSNDIKLNQIALKAYVYTSEKAKSRSASRCKVTNSSFQNLHINFLLKSWAEEDIDNVLLWTRTKDFWFLDGAIILDGTRKLNAISRKEVIE